MQTLLLNREWTRFFYRKGIQECKSRHFIGYAFHGTRKAAKPFCPLDFSSFIWATSSSTLFTSGSRSSGLSRHSLATAEGREDQPSPERLRPDTRCPSSPAKATRQNAFPRYAPDEACFIARKGCCAISNDSCVDATTVPFYSGSIFDECVESGSGWMDAMPVKVGGGGGLLIATAMNQTRSPVVLEEK